MKKSKIISFFIQDGKLSSKANWLLTFLGVLLTWCAWELLTVNFYLAYALFCIATVFGGIAAYSDRWGVKSFTNDPLGWRAAKKTYSDTKSDDSK